jgi:hypothetical protein
MEEPTEISVTSSGFGPPFDAFGDYLPAYLTLESKRALVEALSDFPNNKNYYQEKLLSSWQVRGINSAR